MPNNKFFQELTPIKDYLRMFAASIVGKPVTIVEQSKGVKLAVQRYTERRIILPPFAYPEGQYLIDRDRENLGPGLDYYIALTAIQAQIYKDNQFGPEQLPGLEEQWQKLHHHKQSSIKLLEMGRAAYQLTTEYPHLETIIGSSIGRVFEGRGSPEQLGYLEAQKNSYLLRTMSQGGKLEGVDHFMCVVMEAFERLTHGNKVQNTYQWKSTILPEEIILLLTKPETTVCYSMMAQEKIEAAMRVDFNKSLKPMYESIKYDIVRDIGFNMTGLSINAIGMTQTLLDFLNLDALQIFSPSTETPHVYQQEKSPSGIKRNFTRVNVSESRDIVAGKFDKKSFQDSSQIEQLREKYAELNIVTEKMSERYYYFIESDQHKKEGILKEIKKIESVAKQREVAHEYASSSIASSVTIDKQYAQKIEDEMNQITPAKRSRIRRCTKGSLDMKAYTSFQFGKQWGVSIDPRFFFQIRKNLRDVSSLILADSSQSTSERVGTQTLFEKVAEQAYYFSIALNSLEDPFAVYTYNGYSQKNVDIAPIKTFEEDFSPIRFITRLAKTVPHNNNRDGAALRYGIAQLLLQPSSMKILYHISDMKPRDVTVDEETDQEIAAQKYIGAYALEDTIAAIEEGRSQGVEVIGICVSPENKKSLTPVTSSIKSKINLGALKSVAKAIGDVRGNIDEELKRKFHRNYIKIEDLSSHQIFESLRLFYLNLTF